MQHAVASELKYFSAFVALSIREEYIIGIRCYIRIGRYLVHIRVGTRLHLGTQTSYEAPGDLRAENQVKRSDEHRLSPDSSPEVTLGKPSSI